MPGKRSKSEERERKRLYRQNRTPEQVVLDREKDRNKKKEEWSRKTEEEKDQENYAKRERMKHLRNEISKEKLHSRTTSRDEENRERIRTIRANQSEEENTIERDKARVRMVCVRARQTIERKDEETEKANERMRDLRARQTTEDMEEENEKARERMEMLRAEKSTEVCAYEIIEERQEKSIMRKGLSGKYHLEGNLNAKKGMRQLNSEGRVRKFASREAGMKIGKIDELFEWKQYMKTSKKHKEMLSKNQPDIVSRINENVRLEKERERQTEENRDKEWDYNGESGEYYWTGNTEPEYDQIYDSPSPLTKEGLDRVRQAEEREMMELMKQRKQEMKEKRQKKNEERKRAMETPVAPLPKRELCKYERIREDIIREREEAMAQFKFFENLEKTKTEIGLYKRANKEGNK